jgi:hypothetical protein
MALEADSDPAYQARLLVYVMLIAAVLVDFDQYSELLTRAESAARAAIEPEVKLNFVLTVASQRNDPNSLDRAETYASTMLDSTSRAQALADIAYHSVRRQDIDRALLIAPSIQNDYGSDMIKADVAATVAKAGDYSHAAEVLGQISSEHKSDFAVQKMIRELFDRQTDPSYDDTTPDEAVERFDLQAISRRQRAAQRANLDNETLDRAEGLLGWFRSRERRAEAALDIACRCCRPEQARRLIVAALQSGHWSAALPALAKTRPDVFEAVIGESDELDYT